MASFKRVVLLCTLLLGNGLAHADTVYNWDFDTSWVGNLVADSSGFGVALGPRSQFDATGTTRIRNSTSVAFGSGADFDRTGGVAVLTNGAQVAGLFSGINFKPNAINTATFAQLVDRSNNPFMQVDVWNDGSQGQLVYTNSIGMLQPNKFLSAGTQDPSVVGTPGWQTKGWNTFRIELHADGTAHGFVNGNELGTGTDIQSLTDVNNGSLGVLFTSPRMVIDNFKFGVVSAVPEPETYAMLLAGLGLLAMMAKRRRLS